MAKRCRAVVVAGLLPAVVRNIVDDHDPYRKFRRHLQPSCRRGATMRRRSRRRTGAAHPWRPARLIADDRRPAATRCGLGRGDRVAIVLPNGPEMATAFLSVAAAATTAPLNPAYRADELDFYLTDIGAKAILVADDETGPAVAVAERLGIAVLRLVALRGRAGRQLQASRARRSALPAAAGLPRPATSRCCCTPPAPRRARSWCRSATPILPPRPPISARRSA